MIKVKYVFVTSVNRITYCRNWPIHNKGQCLFFCVFFFFKDKHSGECFTVGRCLSSLCDFFFFLHRLQTQESMLAQSQTCVQELTTELRNRCLELRDLTQRVQDEEKLLHVRLVFKSVSTGWEPGFTTVVVNLCFWPVAPFWHHKVLVTPEKIMLWIYC